MIYFTSDLHLGHNKGFLFEPRGFKTIEEHDENIINNWNNKIANDDDVYVLGDLMLNDVDQGVEKLKKLNGKIHIIRGNHDTDTKWEMYKELPNLVEILNWAEMCKFGKYRIFLCHFPVFVGDPKEDKPLKSRTICFSGHTHFKNKFFNDNPLIYNVSLDAHGNTPVSLDEAINDIKEALDNIKNNLDL